MGIHCEINIFKPAGGGFLPGKEVTGSIKYAIDKETVFKKINVSLKGKGHLSIKRKRKRNSTRTYNSEEYVNVGDVIHQDEHGKAPLPAGCYESQFKFLLPQNIPPTLHCLKNLPRYVVRCHIAYHIRIQFEKPSCFQFNKKFKKEIEVLPVITPRLPNTPMTCEEQKSLMQWFSSRKSIVNIKAIVQNPVVKPGDKLFVEYEVNNDTNIVVKSVETKLVEIHKFTSRSGREIISSRDVKDTDTKTGSIQPGEKKSMPIEIHIPSELASLDNSKIVARDYVVCIIANLPLPHRDAVLNMPVQIVPVDCLNDIGNEDAPPSYWEAMAEYNKSDKTEGESASQSETEV